MTARITEDNLIAAVTRGSWLLLGVLAGAGYVFRSARFATGILAGGILVLANLYWLRSILKRALCLQPAKATRYAHLRYLARLILTGTIIAFLIVRAHIDVMGLLVGLSIVVVTIMALSLYMFADKGE
ncbi:ATP synthase subunit I [Geobacter sp.]|uniref:ATP synthase subunit I n=1 Tax=Geobacter sp. TaxID=46610 RepID=UPI0026368126|nr:ATP synthase subunit I [Geobacter sp.]